MSDPNPSNADSLKLQLLTARQVTGHIGQFTPGGYLSTVIRTTLACIDPTTFRLLVRRATSRATETTNGYKENYQFSIPGIFSLAAGVGFCSFETGIPGGLVSDSVVLKR